MKKYLSMLAVVAVAASAFAQGTVNFSNNGTTLVKAGADAASAVAVPAAGGYVQFLWAPSGSTAGAYTGQSLTAWLGANTAWKAIDTSIKAFGPVAGRFLGGTVSVPTATAGAPIQAIVAAWTGNFASFDAAVAAGTGQWGLSSAFAVATGNPNTTPAGTPGLITGAGGFTGMTITSSIIPEPSTLTLAGLGAAALMIFRRRK